MANDKNYTFIIHEIKNNVTLLQSALQLMKKTHPEIGSYEEWDTIHSAFSDLSNIFQNVTEQKNLSQMEMTTQSIDSFLTSFERRTKQLCSSAEVSVPIFEHGTHSKATPSKMSAIPDDALHPFSISINAPLLERALLNLVQNAIDAMEHSDSKTLLVHTNCDSHKFCISITDSGMGMTEEIQNLMYTPSFTTKGNGLGLGLCIVKEIVNAHQGILLCTSIPNEGTTFTVLLPVSKP